MREEYLGSESDQRYVRAYLANIRTLDPIEIATVEHPISLADASEMKRWINEELFETLVDSCLEEVSTECGLVVSPLKKSRYYTALPEDSESLGGFHDPRSLGYQYWYRGGFVLMLRRGSVSNEVRTIELARSYLHDCLHAETFVSFRRAVRHPAPSPAVAKRRIPEVYREQYGINFRNQDGQSYSSPRLTTSVPETINLNLLMDGLVETVLEKVLRKIAPQIRTNNMVERDVCSEIIGEGQNLIKAATQYYREVIVPTTRFVERWGGEDLARLLLRGMLTGDLNDLKRHFERLVGIEGAWEKKFKRDDFWLPYNSRL
jgi:hypothetical protein